MAERKTKDEIDKLKWDWNCDLCWDIEDTEGFEAHVNELKAHHDACRAKWDAAHNAEREAAIADVEHQIGISGSRKLAEYIIGLEAKIQRIDGYTKVVLHP